jgi:hypothetical protein
VGVDGHSSVEPGLSPCGVGGVKGYGDHSPRRTQSPQSGGLAFRGVLSGGRACPCHPFRGPFEVALLKSSGTPAVLPTPDHSPRSTQSPQREGLGFHSYPGLFTAEGAEPAEGGLGFPLIARIIHRGGRRGRRGRAWPSTHTPDRSPRRTQSPQRGGLAFHSYSGLFTAEDAEPAEGGLGHASLRGRSSPRDAVKIAHRFIGGLRAHSRIGVP